MLFNQFINYSIRKGKFLKLLMSIAFIFGILALNSNSSESYTLHPNRKVISQVNFIPHGNFDALTLSGFGNMLWNWNAQAQKPLVYNEPYLRHYDYTENVYDNLSKVYRVAGTDPNNLAYVRTRVDAYGKVLESDIVVNISQPFANGAVSGRYDIQSVLLHEVGHTIGIDHSQYSNAVMWPYSYTNRTNRTLTNDDRLAVNAKYK